MDEACSALRLQQESKPEPIQVLDRDILTLKIELESLKKETDLPSRERREKLQETLKSKQTEVDELMKIWEQEREEIKELKKTQEDLEAARRDLEVAQRVGNFALASELRYSTIPALEAKIPKEGEQSSKQTLLHDSVTSEDIAKVVSRATGIPTDKMMAGDVEKLVHMEEKLRESVKGQDEALKIVAEAVRLQRAGLTSKKGCPSFMFLGPTGVGKTQLCKSLAEFLFSSENAIIRFDMSEVSRLLIRFPFGISRRIIY